MLTLPIGIVAFATILLLGSPGLAIGTFFNPHAAAVVVLGSFAVLAISSPTRAVLSLGQIFKILVTRGSSPLELSLALAELSRDRESRVGARHPLILHAQGLWERGLDPDTSLLLMKQRMDQLNHETLSAISTLRNLAKYPPALGMMGTVMGLVSLFSNLTMESKSQIGPSLALAMISTFYGLLLANSILMPLADRIQVIHDEIQRENRFVFRILCLIHDGQPPLVVREELYGKAA